MGLFRILRLHKETCFAVLLCIVSVMSYLFGAQVFISAIIFLIALAFVFDERGRTILDKQTSCVYGKNQVRNVDYLIIGDMTDIGDICDKEKKTVCIMAPDRSLEGSFWILKRMFSLLDEESGKAIITVKEKNIKKQGVTLFEYAFLSPVYRNILKVHYLERRRKYPFFYSPVRSLKMICGIKHRSIKTGCLDNSIEDFCRIRGIDVEFRLIR